MNTLTKLPMNTLKIEDAATEIASNVYCAAGEYSKRWQNIVNILTKHYGPGALWQRKIIHPIQTGWIALSERRPTEADADENRQVMARTIGREDVYTIGWSYLANIRDAGIKTTHWLPLPRFQEAAYKDEGFQKWWNEGRFDALEVTKKEMAEMAWRAKSVK